MRVGCDIGESRGPKSWKSGIRLTANRVSEKYERRTCEAYEMLNLQTGKYFGPQLKHVESGRTLRQSLERAPKRGTARMALAKQTSKTAEALEL